MTTLPGPWSDPHDHDLEGNCCRRREPLPGQRVLEFRNVYDDGVDITVRHVLMLPDVDEDELRDYLWEFTGTNRPYGDAGYFVQSIDGEKPSIIEEWC